MTIMSCKNPLKPKSLFVWIVGILRLTGFYIELDADQDSRCGKCFTILSKIYCVVSNIVLWINVFRYLTIFVGENSLSGSLMSSLAFLFFWTLAAYVSLTMSLTLPQNLKKAFKLIDAHRHDIGHKQDYFKHKKAAMVVLCFLIVSGMSLAIFTLSGTSQDLLPSLRRHITPVNHLEGTAYTWGITFYIMMLVFFGIHACGISVFLTVMCVCLYKEFSFLAKMFEDFLTTSDDTKPQGTASNENTVAFPLTGTQITKKPKLVLSDKEDVCLRHLVEGHLRMREVMNLCNKFLSHVIAASYVFVMPIICFLLYGIIRGGLSYDEWIYCSVNGVFNIGVLIIVTGAGILINDKAHDPLQHIFASKWMLASGDSIQTLSLFVTSLTTERIGLSAYGVFIVDRSTTLMVCGTILTYAIVVLQLNPTTESYCEDIMQALNISSKSITL